MSTDTEWSEERIARWRAGAKTERSTMLIRTADFLSLLDALERSRDEAGELVEAMGRLREERDGLKDAFEDVMGALAKALDGDDGYAERPAELVWRLRNQRDALREALQALHGWLVPDMRESILATLKARGEGYMLANEQQQAISNAEALLAGDFD